MFKNGVSVKLGQVGTLPGLNYCPSLGPSMKSCFDIKPFPEVSCPGTADLAEFVSSAAGNRPGILFLCRERNVYLLISSHPGVSVADAFPALPLLPVNLRLFLCVCVFSLHQDLGERSGLSG